MPPPAPIGVSLASEKIFRATSFGVMQIMGETARSSLKFRSNHLSALFDPEINIEMGVRFMAQLLEQYKHLPEDQRYFKMLHRYNGSLEYPPLVLGHITARRHLEFLRQEV